MANRRQGVVQPLTIRQNSIELQAMRIGKGNIEEIGRWIKENDGMVGYAIGGADNHPFWVISVFNNNGLSEGHIGDWCIRWHNGEFHFISNDIFKNLYTPRPAK